MRWLMISPTGWRNPPTSCEMTMRLSNSSLASLPPAIAQPGYDRARVSPGIVHLGIGAFHRAHKAVMTEALLAEGATDWGIIAASLRSPETRNALAPQDGLYTLSVQAPGGERLQVIGAIAEVLVAPEDPGRLIALMADPRIRIVSLTVTEKGYCHDPATGALDERHPDIVHDLANLARPRSAVGFLAAALQLRQAAGAPPFTVLCCDNLPSNGRTVRRVLARFAALADPALGEWIEAHVACPCTMVDRIVPATTDADRSRISAALGFEDAWPVVSEPFIQWVIEDDFPSGRPAWEQAGAEFVSEVAPYELMKLRMLNGAHSSLAYLGYLAGRETVADASNEPLFAGYLAGLWTEAAPTLPQGLDSGDYAMRLLARFQNRAIRHRLWQIAMDGSQKLPQRLLGTIRDRLAKDAPIDHLALAVAGWMRFVGGIDERGAAIDVRDPMAARLRAITEAAGQDAAKAAPALAAVSEIFGHDLPADPRFMTPVTRALESLFAGGARASVSALLARTNPPQGRA